MGVDNKPHRYEAIAVSSESTVVAEYIPDETRDTAFQSEAQLEKILLNSYNHKLLNTYQLILRKS